jgi:hypothetical protein
VEEETDMELEEIQMSLSASGQINAAGKFEVDVINAGNGNGYQFTEKP